MQRSRTVLAGILVAVLPFLATNIAHSAPLDKTGKTTVTKAKTAKKKKHSVKRTRSHAVKASVASNRTPSKGTMMPALAMTAPAAAMTAPLATNPYLALANTSNAPANEASHPAGEAPAAINPYLAYRYPNVPAAAATPEPAKAQESATSPTTNPYLAHQPQRTEPANPWNTAGSALSQVKLALPSLPGGEFSLLPKIKTVYPTGEKPLKVLTFKCPTELVGITTPPIKIMREGVNLAMEGINRTNLLPFNMQQVCM